MGCTGYSHRDLGDEAWVNRLGDKVIGAEGEVVHLINLVDNIGYRLLGQVGNGSYGSQFHLFVNSGSSYIKCAAEDVGEADNIINLIGIVASTG